MSLIARRTRRRPELPLVPLIDVLVMLVLFAYVTMQARSAATLNITLPKVETAGRNEFAGKVTIAIDKDGKLSVNGQIVTDEELHALLQQVKNVDRDIPILLMADETSQVGKLAFVMDTCRKLGLNKFSIQSR